MAEIPRARSADRRPSTGSLLVAGTSSGAGKSTIVAGLCRWLARQGVSVAPFKAQNMSLNSFVTPQHEEIGRAQALQAQAAGIEPEALMNPVLIKPGAGHHAQVIVQGHAVADVDAAQRWGDTTSLLDMVADCYHQLRARFDVVVCEGAGSAAEINLRDTDIVNMGFARKVGAPVVVVGDIDRGGVFASMVGTLALLSSEDQGLVRGFVVNRFRGDVELLRPGLDMLEQLTRRRVFGVIPFTDLRALDAEDSLELRTQVDAGRPEGPDVLRVAVVCLPRASNLTDVDPLVAEPGVIVRFASRPEELTDADLVIVPGTRATVADLTWMRSRGFDAALKERARRGRPVLGICGGYQMLGANIDDAYESGAGTVPGLSLLAVRTTFASTKALSRPRRDLPDGTTIEGYEIHQGMTERLAGAEPFFADEGCRLGAVAGTAWHGLFENDGFRRSYLQDVAARCQRQYVASSTRFAAVREAHLDALADLVECHLDTDGLLEVIGGAHVSPGSIHLTPQVADVEGAPQRPR